MKKGSITPFCAVALAIVASLLLVLLESARVYGLNCYATWKANEVIDSLCAEYQPVLWQEYGLLFLDGAYGTENFSMGYVLEQMGKYMEQSCSNGSDLFALDKGEVLLEGYALATDEEGELFLTYVARREKENLPLALAADIYQQYRERDKVAGNQTSVKDAIAQAQEVIRDVKTEWILKWESKEETEESEKEFYMPDTSVAEEVLDGAEKILSNGILNMIFTDLTSIATGSLAPESDLQMRQKEKGNMYLNTEDDWYQRMLVLSYLERYFSNYINEKEGHFLEYELEYVLCGEHTEWENLAQALEKILLIREAGNIACLLQDEEKMSAVKGLASLIGWMAGENPVVIKAVETGLVGAWAYMESILDVRSLVVGAKIPLVKQPDEWTSELSNMFSVFDTSTKAKCCENGLSYEDYLKQLIYLMEKHTLAYRMMEVMELTMTSRDAYVNSRMDHMLVMLRCKVGFESRPLFSSLVAEGKAFLGKYQFIKKVERSYVP